VTAVALECVGGFEEHHVSVLELGRTASDADSAQEEVDS
jgi:hypothetical protein